MDLSLMGERIKHTRIKQKLTLEKLSEKVGISRNFLWEIESGRKAPAIQTLHSICKALNVSADYLLGFSTVQSQPDSGVGENTVLQIYNIIESLDDKEIFVLHELLGTYSKYKNHS